MRGGKAEPPEAPTYLIGNCGCGLRRDKICCNNFSRNRAYRRAEREP